MININPFGQDAKQWLQANGTQIEVPDTYSGQKYLGCFINSGPDNRAEIIQDESDFQVHKQPDGGIRTWFLIAKPAVEKLSGMLREDE